MAPSPARSIADCRVEFRALDTHIDVAANNGRPSPPCFQRTRRAGPPTSPCTGVPFSAPASPTNVRRGESKRPSTSIHVASIVACYCVSQPPPQHQSSDILTNTNTTSVRCATASAGDSITHLSRGIHTTLPSMWETKQLCEVGKLQVGDTSAEAVEGTFFLSLA